MKTGIANMPLHGGKAPRWLFEKMVELGREITLAVVDEYSPEEYIQRLADPFWFQALGCVLGYDWHSSGLTTVTGGALKVALKGIEKETGIFVCGGKGGTSRKTPDEILSFSAKSQISKSQSQNLVYASKMAAKVDNTALQDGYQLYHHNFFFTVDGKWSVVQQGMNKNNKMARRYHWFSENLTDFTEEPQAAVCCDDKKPSLNLVAKESREARNFSVQLSSDTKTAWKDLEYIDSLDMPRHHQIYRKEKYATTYLDKILGKIKEHNPENYEQLLSIKGVGPKTVRAFSLVGELIYGKKPSYKDPARFSFVHGGKDGVPYPVDENLYNKSIEVLRKGINKANIDRSDKKKAFQRLEE
ncbi:MAG: DUF763 domain-containing protein [Patescibacteria group bacterium]